jgi:predicted ATPase
VVESNGQDVRVPWFSGLCLEGEVAGQYEIERSGSQQEHQDPTKASQLELDGLAPITIFVGANNSGKSRLMRELFGNSEAAKCLQVGSDSEQLKSDLRELLVPT